MRPKQEKPPFKAYVRNLFPTIFNIPLESGGKRWLLAGCKMYLFSQLALAAVLWVIYCFSPYSNGYYKEIATAVTVAAGLILSALYWIFFVYYTGAFEDADNPDGAPRASVWRSRAFLGLLLAVLCAAAAAYAAWGYGRAADRIFSGYRQELKGLEECCAAYDQFTIYAADDDVYGYKMLPDANPPTMLELQDDAATVSTLKDVLRKLRQEYVTRIYWKKGEGMHIAQRSGFTSSGLVWFPERMSAEQVLKSTGIPIKSIAQLDEHWWKATEDTRPLLEY